MKEVEECHPSTPMPYKTLIWTYLSVLVAVALVPNYLAFKVTAFLCTVTTLLTIFNKVCHRFMYVSSVSDFVFHFRSIIPHWQCF